MHMCVCCVAFICTQGWNNLTRASLVLDLALQPYSPVSSIKSVQPPTLIVAGAGSDGCPA